MWWWWCKIKFFHLLVIHLASSLISFATSLIICYYYVSSLLWNMHFYFTYSWLIYRGSLRLLSWIFLVFLHCCWWFLCCTVSTCYCTWFFIIAVFTRYLWRARRNIYNWYLNILFGTSTWWNCFNFAGLQLNLNFQLNCLKTQLHSRERVR